MDPARRGRCTGLSNWQAQTLTRPANGGRANTATHALRDELPKKWAALAAAELMEGVPCCQEKPPWDAKAVKAVEEGMGSGVVARFGSALDPQQAHHTRFL